MKRFNEKYLVDFKRLPNSFVLKNQFSRPFEELAEALS